MTWTIPSDFPMPTKTTVYPHKPIIGDPKLPLDPFKLQPRTGRIDWGDMEKRGLMVSTAFECITAALDGAAAPEFVTGAQVALAKWVLETFGLDT